MDSIGIRELRQHASRYLERVVQGESLEITDRGRPVARLIPVNTDPWENLIASGSVTAAEDGTDVTEELPGDYDVDASAVLTAMRFEER